MRPATQPDVSRHPTTDGGDRPPPPEDDPYQAPVVEPSALVADEEPLAPLEADARTAADAPTSPEPTPAPDAPVAQTRAAAPPVDGGRGGDADATWVAAVDGGCPDGYPVKAKLRSGIYHLPGMLAYQRTVPDRCYPTADAAAADGLRPAKR
jgi:hypothetical protein